MLKAQLAQLLNQADTVKINSLIPDPIDVTGDLITLITNDYERIWEIKDQEVSLDAQGQVQVLALKKGTCDPEEQLCVLEFFMHRPLAEADLTA